MNDNKVVENLVEKLPDQILTGHCVVEDGCVEEKLPPQPSPVAANEIVGQNRFSHPFSANEKPTKHQLDEYLDSIITDIYRNQNSTNTMVSTQRKRSQKRLFGSRSRSPSPGHNVPRRSTLYICDYEDDESRSTESPITAVTLLTGKGSTSSISSLQPHQFNTSSSNSSITNPQIKPKIRNQYRVLPRAMHILRNDVRRQYGHMLVNVLNSYDPQLLHAFLTKFASPNVIFVGEFGRWASPQHQFPIWRSLVGNTRNYEFVPNISVQGIDRFVSFMRSSWVLTPDRTIKPINDCFELKTFSNSECCEISGLFELKATFIYNITPTSLVQLLRERLQMVLLQQQQSKNAIEIEAMNHQRRLLNFFQSFLMQRTETEQDGLVSVLASLVSQLNLAEPKQYSQVVRGRIRVNEHRMIDAIHFIQQK